MFSLQIAGISTYLLPLWLDFECFRGWFLRWNLALQFWMCAVFFTTFMPVVAFAEDVTGGHADYLMEH